MRRALFVGVILMLCLSIHTNTDAAAGDTTDQSKVYRVGYGSTWCALQGVEAAEFCGIRCLKGRLISEKGAVSGIRYIPIDKVLSVSEYTSIEEYLKSRSRASPITRPDAQPDTGGNAR